MLQITSTDVEEVEEENEMGMIQVHWKMAVKWVCVCKRAFMCYKQLY